MSGSPKSKKSRAARFNIEIPGDAETKQRIFGKLKLIKDSSFNPSSTKLDILEGIIDKFIEDKDVQSSNITAPLPNPQLDKSLEEKIFLITKSALNSMVNVINSHKFCNGNLTMNTGKPLTQGFVNRFELRCTKGMCNKLSQSERFISTSTAYDKPKEDGGTLPVKTMNYRVAHAFYSSGLLPSQFDSLFSRLGISYQPKTLRHFINSYHDATEEVRLSKIFGFQTFC